jgi:phage-related protein
MAAKDAIRNFPTEVKKSLGKAIWELQKGERLGMPISRPMPSVGPGVEELRVKDETGAFRAFYYARSSRGILIFHAFGKKSRATPASEIKLGQKRLKELLNETT